jgi:hypothetical protein
MLVGIAGTQGRGKEVVANVVARFYGFQRQSIDDPIKVACRSAFLLSHDQVHNPEALSRVDPRWGVTPERILEVVGHNLFRQALDEHLPELKTGGPAGMWTHRFRLWFQEHGKNARIVVPDLRYPNEVALMQELGAVLIRVRGPPDPALPAEPLLNPDAFAVTLVDDGTLDELEIKAVAAVVEHVLHLPPPTPVLNISLHSGVEPPPKRHKAAQDEPDEKEKEP